MTLCSVVSDKEIFKSFYIDNLIFNLCELCDGPEPFEQLLKRVIPAKSGQTLACSLEDVLWRNCWRRTSNDRNNSPWAAKTPKKKVCVVLTNLDWMCPGSAMEEFWIACVSSV